jgi:tetratricopeptide (TPR) repeat protein
VSAICEKLHPFVDGELDDREAQAFRRHLGECARCPAELEATVLCDALAEEALAAGPRRARTVELAAPPPAAAAPAHPLDELAARRRRRGLLAAVSGVAFAAAATILLTRAPPPAAPLAALLDGPYRSIEGRLAYPGADGYRPLSRLRGGPEPAAPRADRTAALARLEESGDHHGLGVGLLLEGQLEQAARQLAAAPPSPQVLSDSAALALERGQAREALALADRALALQPRHPQATWNRAVALELQGQRDQAAAAFDAVAALGEPGWTDEARRRAGDLRAH